MQFRPDNPISPKKHKERRRQRRWLSLPMVTTMTLVLLGAGAIYGFQHRDGNTSSKVSLLEPVETHFKHSRINHRNLDMVERTRLRRSEIPRLDLNTMSYAELFNDTNSTQRVEAVRNGLKSPEAVTNLDACSELLRIGSNELYVVDTMYFSKPYLVPEAVLLMDMIGERFQEVMAEHHPEYQHIRPVVTSALRSNQDVTNLRRRNRNASDSSCHVFGTTVDISYTRFLTDDGDYAMEPFLKPMLALTLYELRHEGLIYVKHERRQACFHLTLRSTNYIGNGKSETRQYIQPHRWDRKDLGHLAMRAKHNPQRITTTTTPVSRPASNKRTKQKQSQNKHNAASKPTVTKSKKAKTNQSSPDRYQVEPSHNSRRHDNDDPRAERIYGGLIDDDSYIVH